MVKPPPLYPVPAVRPIPPAVIADAVVAELQAKPTDTYVRRIDERPARYATWPEGLHPKLIATLKRRGIEAPYTHQAKAITAALNSDASVSPLELTVTPCSAAMAEPAPSAARLCEGR